MAIITTINSVANHFSKFFRNTGFKKVDDRSNRKPIKAIVQKLVPVKVSCNTARILPSELMLSQYFEIVATNSTPIMIKIGITPRFESVAVRIRKAAILMRNIAIPLVSLIESSLFEKKKDAR